MASNPADGARAPSSRWPWLDGLRGVAIVGMAVYHLVWDLYFFRFVPVDVLRSPVFVLFGHTIACAFLGIAGFALALAHREGRRGQAFVIRLGKIAAAAGLVTLATYIAFPQTFVRFGILHCIAVASAASWLFMRQAWPVALVAGAAIFGLGSLIENPRFDDVNEWLGLGARLPLTNDWRPTFPWAGALLIGLGLGQLALSRGWFAAALRPAPPAALQLAGRHSLAIYLLHQPLLFALVWAAAQIMPPVSAPVPVDGFVQACVRNCVEKSSAAFCGKACPCIAGEARAAGVWSDLVQGSMGRQAQEKYNSIIALCQRQATE